MHFSNTCSSEKKYRDRNITIALNCNSEPLFVFLFKEKIFLQENHPVGP